MGLRMTIASWSTPDELATIFNNYGESDDCVDIDESWAGLEAVFQHRNRREETQLQEFFTDCVLDPNETRALAAEMAALTVERLEAELDLSALDDVYGLSGGDDVEYLAGGYKDARDFVMAAAERGLGVMGCIG